MSEIKREDLELGMMVTITPRDDRTRKKLVEGTISEILTHSNKHTHGILVKLESGAIGRVKNLSSNRSHNQLKKVSTVEHILTNSLSVEELLHQGENHFIEFKKDALWSAKLSGSELQNYYPQSNELKKYGKNTSKFIIAKSLAGFLNSDGGVLLIGVKENKDSREDEIVGVDAELWKLKDPCIDGYRRMLVDLIKDFLPSNIFNHMDKYINISFLKIEDKTLCAINVHKSDKRVFLKYKMDEYFFIRTDASTREITGEDIVDFCENRFSK